MQRWIDTEELARLLGKDIRQAQRIIKACAYKKQPLIVRQEKITQGKGRPSYLVLWGTTTNQPATLADQQATGEPFEKLKEEKGASIDSQNLRTSTEPAIATTAGLCGDVKPSLSLDSNTTQTTTGEHHEQSSDRIQNKADMADTERFLETTRTQGSKSMGNQKAESAGVENQSNTFSRSTREVSDIGRKQPAEMSSTSPLTGDHHATTENPARARLLPEQITEVSSHARHPEPVTNSSQDASGRDCLHEKLPQDLVSQTSTSQDLAPNLLTLGENDGYNRDNTDTALSRHCETHECSVPEVSQDPHHRRPVGTSGVSAAGDDYQDRAVRAVQLGKPIHLSCALLTLAEQSDLSGERQTVDEPQNTLQLDSISETNQYSESKLMSLNSDIHVINGWVMDTSTGKQLFPAGFDCQLDYVLELIKEKSGWRINNSPVDEVSLKKAKKAVATFKSECLSLYYASLIIPESLTQTWNTAVKQDFVKQYQKTGELGAGSIPERLLVEGGREADDPPAELRNVVEQ